MEALNQSSVQWKEVNVLEGRLLVPPVDRILACAPFGLAHADPIGRLITGAGKALPFHKRFQQVNGMTVLALPVRADPALDQAQNVTGQPH